MKAPTSVRRRFRHARPRPLVPWLCLLGMFLPVAVPAQSPPSRPFDDVVAAPEGYVCPMHPNYRAEQPGTCPICGMDLVPLSAEARSAGGAISVPAEMIQTMGVRVRPVEVVDFGRRVRAFGSVEASTRLQTVVASRVEGWIELLAVTAEGDPVERGELLYRVFSPDLVAAQQDYLAALRTANEGRVESAGRRLLALGMQAGVVATLARERRLLEQVPVYAESTGIVSVLGVREGAYVKPGDVVLRLQSYEEVWVIAAVAEQDLADVRPGMPAVLEFPTLTGAATRGTVDYVYPEIDPRTRTGRVRIVVPNADGVRKPGAYTDVQFEVDGRERLAVPSEAVLRDSSGSHVIVALGDGRFAGRRITTGITASGRTEVLRGLIAGEPVVVSGQFMLDSEASLREAFTKLGGIHAGHDHGAMEGGARMSPVPGAAEGHGDHDMVTPQADDHAGHDMAMPEEHDHAGQDMAMPQADPHSDHDMSMQDGGDEHAGHDMADAADADGTERDPPRQRR